MAVGISYKYFIILGINAKNTNKMIAGTCELLPTTAALAYIKDNLVTIEKSFTHFIISRFVLISSGCGKTIQGKSVR